jgi:dihydropteroate synthase
LIGNILNKPVTERLYGSLALAVLAVSKGATVIRTHDVAATVDAIKMTDAVLGMVTK